MQSRPCVTASAQTQLQLRSQWALSPNFWGLIDLVTNTAWDFKEDAKGMIYPEPLDEIPAEFVEIAAEKREELLEAASDSLRTS